MAYSDEKTDASDTSSLESTFNSDAVQEENPYIVSDELISEVEEALQRQDEPRVTEIISDLNNANTAELFEKLTDDHRRRLLQEHAAEFPAEFFSELDTNLRKNILESMEPAAVAAMIADLSSDDALDLILNLDAEFQADVIRKLSSKTRMTLEEGLSFPEESAGRLMQREVVAIPQFWTTGKTIDYLRAAGDNIPDEFFDIFVISPTYRVVGEIPLSKLIRAKRSQRLEDLTLEETHPIPATMDQEDVAELFRRDNLTSAPVVDEEERIIGVITIDDVVDVIDEEASEDFLRLAGVEADDIYSALFSTTKSRFRWLFVNLLTAILASVVISFFDGTIEKVVALAVLMPIVASMGGNAATQAMTVAVRALATRDISKSNALRMIWKETLVGTMNGAAFAIIMGLIAGIWFQNPVLGTVIASAMVLNLIVAGISGAGIPIFLHAKGSDPAVSSAVFVTTVTDIVGFLAFLGLAALFLVQ